MAAKCIRTGGLCAALCSGALALLVPCVGKADDVLPAATYTAEAEYYVNGYVLYQYSGNVYGTDLHFDGGSVPSGTLGIQPSPFATVIGSSPLGWGLTPNLPFGVSISDSVTVYMEIPGVSISTLVPVDVVGLASGSVSVSPWRHLIRVYRLRQRFNGLARDGRHIPGRQRPHVRDRSDLPGRQPRRSTRGKPRRW